MDIDSMHIPFVPKLYLDITQYSVFPDIRWNEMWILQMPKISWPIIIWLPPPITLKPYALCQNGCIVMLFVNAAAPMQ